MSQKRLLPNALVLLVALTAITIGAVPPANPPVSFAGSGIPETHVAETEVADQPAFDGTPSSLVIGRNFRNSVATLISARVAEPAAANSGSDVFYVGNRIDGNPGVYASYSADGGSSWTAVPVPTGPSDAPIPFADPDVVYDHTRNVTFWSLVYTNGTSDPITNGVVRIFVRRAILGEDDCFYDFDPAGSLNNIIPDYPHLGLSNNYLYLSTNNVSSTSGSWLNSQVRRISLDQMASCTPIDTSSVEVFTYSGGFGKRYFVPVEGARETMYWGMLESNSSFRIYRWPESAPTPTYVTWFLTSPSTFTTMPDCSGGVGNTNFIRPENVEVNGQTMRGAVGAGQISFFWNVALDLDHPQVHVHGVVFDEALAFQDPPPARNKAIIVEPSISASDRCFAFPAVSVNVRGDLGLTIAGGGKAGGGGIAAQGYVGIHDEYTDTTVGYFEPLVRTAIGTHNPTSDSRYGDYFTIHPQRPCGSFFAATNYALFGGNSGSAYVNARYVEFGRGRDYPCYFGSSETTIPLYTWHSDSREDHFGTTDPFWAGTTDTRSPDYRFSRIEGYVYTPIYSQPTGTVPLYSWYSPSRGDNWLTTQYGPSQGTLQPDYHFVRLEGYISTSPGVDTVPLYSLYNSSFEDNSATTKPTSQPPGYTQYRLEGYILPPPVHRIFLPTCAR